MAKGGFGEALQLNKPSAAKTGTSENNKTVWFNGYTPTLATSAVVAGLNSEGEPTSLNYISLNGRYYGVAHGSTVAGPMWANAMRAVQNLIPYRDFAGPGGDPDQSGLPGVVGMSVENASAALRSAGFTPVQAGVVDGGGSGVVSQVTKGTDGKTAYMFISR